MMNLTKIFFLSFMMIGIMICLCSNNWLFIWCGLELNLISFLPLIHSKFIISSESSMKYFLVQSISSSILILGMIGMFLKLHNYDELILVSILIKMGVPPFHLWVLSLIDGLNMLTMMLIFSIMKVAPLIILTFLLFFSISLIVTFTIISGAISGINQCSMKKIISYSSIFNMGLLLISIKSNLVWIYYLLIYSILTWMLIFLIFKINVFYVNQMIMNESLLFNKITFWLLMLSMGGLPPLIGFSIKLIIIEFSISNLLIFNLVLIISFSLLVMFFYVRMTYLSLLFFSTSFKWMILNLSKSQIFLFIFNVLTLPIYLTIKIFN
nr:NADH dehydrogenase subunit 2 [Kaukania anser]